MKWSPLQKGTTHNMKMDIGHLKRMSMWVGTSIEKLMKI
jgi:hypothetical protein